MAKASKTAGAKATGKRELMEPNGDKRFVRRSDNGQISESDDVGKSLSKDVRQHAKNEVKPGYGDKGDQKRTSAKKK